MEIFQIPHFQAFLKKTFEKFICLEFGLNMEHDSLDWYTVNMCIVRQRIIHLIRLETKEAFCITCCQMKEHIPWSETVMNEKIIQYYFTKFPLTDPEEPFIMPLSCPSSAPYFTLFYFMGKQFFNESIQHMVAKKIANVVFPNKKQKFSTTTLSIGISSGFYCYEIPGEFNRNCNPLGFLYQNQKLFTSLVEDILLYLKNKWTPQEDETYLLFQWVLEKRRGVQNMPLDVMKIIWGYF